jgi:hypothetical protein
VIKSESVGLGLVDLNLVVYDVPQPFAEDRASEGIHFYWIKDDF